MEFKGLRKGRAGMWKCCWAGFSGKALVPDLPGQWTFRFLKGSGAQVLVKSQLFGSVRG